VTVQPLRHGYTNSTTGDGKTVVKRYLGVDWQNRRTTEASMLLLLPDDFPAPALIDLSGPTLTMGFLPGVQGQELIEAGDAVPVLRSCGEMLRRVQALGLATPVLVHGDYGPQNMLFDPDTFAVTAVLDWEWAHGGDPIEDLAWAEWIVRTHHPSEVGALDALFEGYGGRPAFGERRTAALVKCRQMRERPGAGSVWQRRIEATAAWAE
jgi:tRNA A-37 threonylcarbamoyl transferase component Bud32